MSSENPTYQWGLEDLLATVTFAVVLIPGAIFVITSVIPELIKVAKNFQH